MTEDLNTPMLHMRLPSRGSKILRKVTMKRKDDLTMTNKQMLVAQLREEQEQNRILRIELEKAKREKNFAERDLDAAIYMFNDESRKVQSRINRYKAEIERLQDKCEELRNEKWDAQDDLDCYCDEMPNKIKQAKIDVLNELKKRARTSYVLDDFILGSVVFSKDIDELIKEVQDE